MSYKMLRRQLLAAAAGITALSVFGSGIALSQSLNLTPIPKSPVRTITFGVGGTEPDLGYLPMWVAKYGGFFDALKADGINVELVAFPGGAEAILALASGQVPLMYQSFENAIRARAQGRDVTAIFSSTIAPGPVIVIRKDLADKVKSLSDTKGLRWGITSLGAATHAISMRLARYSGVDPAAIQWTPVGGMSGTVPALREKRIDVLAASITARNILVSEGLAVELFNPNPPDVTRKVFGHDYLGLTVLSSKKYTDENSYVVYKVLEAVRKATDKIRSSTGAEIIKILPTQFQSSTAVATIDEMSRNLNKDGFIEPQTAVKMAGDLDDLKMTRTSVDPTAAVDNRFVEELRKQLGK